MAAKRVIPCLDVKDGRVVKGVKFQNLRDMGHPAELACRYDLEGADEVVFLDISASDENRGTQEAWVREVAHALSIPFTVGGGRQQRGGRAPPAAGGRRQGGHQHRGGEES